MEDAPCFPPQGAGVTQLSHHLSVVTEVNMALRSPHSSHFALESSSVAGENGEIFGERATQP